MPTISVLRAGRLPSSASHDKKKNVDIFDDQWSVNNPVLLHHHGGGEVEYIGEGGGSSVFHCGTIRSTLPLEVIGFRSAFGLELLCTGSRGFIAIGLCSQGYSTSSFPGWDTDSVGYHADVGRLLIGGKGEEGELVSTPCQPGDILSCSIHEDPLEDQQVVVVFGRNGDELSRVTMVMPSGGLFALVGMMSSQERIRLFADVNSLPNVVTTMSVFRSLSPYPSESHPPLVSEGSPDVSQLQVRPNSPGDSLPVGPVTMALQNQFLALICVDHISTSPQGWHTLSYSPRLSATPADTPPTGFIMSRRRISEKMPYFELVVGSCAAGTDLAVGVAPSGYPMDRFPGLGCHSLAYNISNNVCSLWVSGKRETRTEGTVTAGDVIGVELDCEDLLKPFCENDSPNRYRSTVDVQARVTHNNTLKGVITFPLPPGGVYPAVGITGSAAELKLVCSLGLTPSSYFNRHPVPDGYCNLSLAQVKTQGAWLQNHNMYLHSSNMMQVKDCSKMAIAWSSRCMTAQTSYFQVKLASRVEEFDQLILCLSDCPHSSRELVSFLPLCPALAVGEARPTALQLDWKRRSSQETPTFGMGVDYRTWDSTSADVFLTYQRMEVARVRVSLPRMLCPCIKLRAKTGVVAVTSSNPTTWPPKTPYGRGMARGSRFISCAFGCVIGYCGNGSQREMGVVQSATPLTPTYPYYEVSVVFPGPDGYIGVGLAHTSYPMDKQPGWCPESIGFHLDDGKLYHGPEVAMRVAPPSPYQGTVVGCGVVFPPEETQHPGREMVEVFFMLNNKLIGRWLTNVPRCGFFPTVGLNSVETNVEVSLPLSCPLQLPFSYTWHILPSGAGLSSLSRSYLAGGLPLLTTSELALQPQAAAVSHCSYAAHTGDYFCVRHPLPSHGAADVQVGYVSVADDGAQSHSQDWTHQSVLVNVASGSVLCNFKEVGPIPDWGVTPCQSIGCGLKDSASEEPLFFVCVDHQMVFIIPLAHGHALHRVLRCGAGSAQVGVECCQTWPPWSPAGIGWGKTSEMVAYRGSNLMSNASQEEGGTTKPSFVLGAEPLTPELGSYFEVVSVGRDKSKFDVGVATQDFTVDLQTKEGKTHLKRPKSSEYVMYQSEGRVHGKFRGLQSCRVPKVVVGDTVGCGLVQEAGRDSQRIFFTHNGHVVAQYPLMTQRPFYPVVVAQGAAVLQANLRASFAWSSLGGTWPWGFVQGVTPFANNKFKYIASSNQQCGVVQAASPLTEANNCFSVDVIGCGENPSIAVGVARKLTALDLLQSAVPHLANLYQADGCVLLQGKTAGPKAVPHLADLYPADGCVLLQGKTAEPKAVCYTQGDSISCALTLHSSGYLLEFLKNGCSVSTCPLGVVQRDGLFPVVLLGKKEESVRVRLSHPHPPPHEPPFPGWARSSRHLQPEGRILRYVSAGELPGEGIAQIQRPLTPGGDFSYFEVEILRSEGQERCVSVGVAPLDHALDCQAGKHKSSVAYCCSSGAIVIHSSNDRFGPAVTSGAVLGVGLREVVDGACVYFTINGIELGHIPLPLSPSTALHPTISLAHCTDVVRIDSGALPFHCTRAHRLWQMLVAMTVSSAGGRDVHALRRSPLAPSQQVGLAVAASPFSSDCAFFEVEIVSFGKQPSVAVGVAPKYHPPSRLPGRVANSFAYQSNGKLFKEHCTGQVVGPPSLRVGDRVGCGLEYSRDSSTRGMLYFTVNGMQVSRFRVTVPSEGLFPAVGVDSGMDQVLIRCYPKDRYPTPLIPPPIGLRGTHHVKYWEQEMRYSGDPSSREVGVVQFLLPHTEESYVLKVCINRFLPAAGEDTVVVGLADAHYPTSVWAGQIPLSVGYNLGEGRVSEALDEGRKVEYNVSTCVEKDIVGVALLDAPPTIYFSHNHQVVLTLPCPEALLTSLLPVINITSKSGDAILFVYWSPWEHEPSNNLNC